MLILTVNETFPSLAGMPAFFFTNWQVNLTDLSLRSYWFRLILPAEDIIESGIQFDLIFVKIFKEFFGAENLGNADELVVVIMTVEERLLAENHRSQHTTQ